MKKNLFLFLLLLVFMSCNKDNDVTKETVDYSKYENMSEEELRIEAAKLGAVTLQQLLEETAAELLPEEQVIIDSGEINLRGEAIMTVKGYKSSSAFKKNQKVLISKSPTRLPTGVYIVDTYEVRMEAKLPSGSLGIPMDSPKCGFDPNNIGSSRRGYRYVGQTGTTFYMSTIGYQVKSNMMGQMFNVWDPTLSKLEWVIKYIY